MIPIEEMYNFMQFFIIWENLFSYSHGDIDGIIGNPDVSFVYPEGSISDLAESTRFSRKGYKI